LPISPWLRDLRARIGHDLLLLPAVAAVIHDPSGRVLLMRPGVNAAFGLPAGMIEPGETPAAAVIREVYEETGLLVSVDRVAGVFGGPAFRTRYPNGDWVEYTVIVFHCRVESGHLHPRDGEAEALQWFSPEELPPLSMPYPPTILRADNAPAHFQSEDGTTLVGGLPPIYTRTVEP
jgi:8-oxo-dGTP pyrophosphatase MutT (NUDIX family)